MKMTSSSSSHFHLPGVITNINSIRPYNHIYNHQLNKYHQQLTKNILFLSIKQLFIDDETTHANKNEGFGVIDLLGKVVVDVIVRAIRVDASDDVREVEMRGR
ncbi:hypothetical protein Tco_1349733 [Tanacetum coccineum]